MNAFRDFGIFDIDRNGRATCPRCSQDRKKSRERCLAVNVDEGVWFCHHCEWRGSLKNKATNIVDFEIRRREKSARLTGGLDKARKVWAHGRSCKTHPYIKKKRIHPCGARRRAHQLGCPELMVPIWDGDALASIQFISATGNKRFAANTRVKGNYFVIPGSDTLAICEGFATGCSLYIGTGYTVYAALSASNLLSVAQRIRKANPKAKMIVAAGHDDVGLKNGRQAAKSVNAILIYPPESGDDFNDLAIKKGGGDE